MAKVHKVPCAHGEHGPCLKCQLIEERLAGCADERKFLRPRSNQVMEDGDNG